MPIEVKINNVAETFSSPSQELLEFILSDPQAAGEFKVSFVAASESLFHNFLCFLAKSWKHWRFIIGTNSSFPSSGSGFYKRKLTATAIKSGLSGLRKSDPRFYSPFFGREVGRFLSASEGRVTFDLSTVPRKSAAVVAIRFAGLARWLETHPTSVTFYTSKPISCETFEAMTLLQISGSDARSKLLKRRSVSPPATR